MRLRACPFAGGTSLVSRSPHAVHMSSARWTDLDASVSRPDLPERATLQQNRMRARARNTETPRLSVADPLAALALTAFLLTARAHAVAAADVEGATSATTRVPEQTIARSASAAAAGTAPTRATPVAAPTTRGRDVAGVAGATETQATSTTARPTAKSAVQDWYGRNPFVDVVRDTPSAPSTSGTDPPPPAPHPAPQPDNNLSISDMSFQERIKWLNQVTSRITDELDTVHPPPLRNIVAKATSSDIAQELQGVGKVFGSVASDLKEGFIGLEGTIEGLAKRDDGVKAPPPITDVDDK